MFNFLKCLDRVKLKVCFSAHRFFTINSFLRNKNCKNQHPWKIVFYGTDDLSKVTLDALYTNSISSIDSKIVDEVDVVCIKWDCPVRRYATCNNLTVYTWPYNLPNDAYDVGIVVSFGHMLPTDSIHACKYGIINAHPSLLPRWRGAAPIIHTILNGDAETGVTITQVSPNKFDVGKILMQEKYIIPEGCSATALTRELSKVASDLIMKTLRNLPYYVEFSYPQPKEGAKYARKIKPEQGNINWEQDSSLFIYRKYKAFHGFFDIYTFWKNVRIVVLEFATPDVVEKANVSTLVEPSVQPGFCYFHKKRKILFVKCQDNWCGILSVKIPKRGKISAQDFYNGFISKEEPNKCYFHANNKNVESYKSILLYQKIISKFYW
ncbi:methionyl-tRNA formyltransferase, mitochondrial [Trichonephila clavata]|uniref:Methionyl-tRNA formyltransferase, mitochondrial n=1 Tax=Trichonephila clavata TaxID=2740835 RepID=A0A8X6GCW6_TRICU|nr:methionyl-tRNA formyltransferase, mitochondrial [Trichonephila clavata]